LHIGLDAQFIGRMAKRPRDGGVGVDPWIKVADYANSNLAGHGITPVHGTR
jgi:hypothetical protein